MSIIADIRYGLHYIFDFTFTQTKRQFPFSWCTSCFYKTLCGGKFDENEDIYNALFLEHFIYCILKNIKSTMKNDIYENAIKETNISKETK